MIIFNLPQSMKPMNVSKGVNADATKVMPPQPMFDIRPFENHFNLRSDESIMGYNQFGNFTATSMVAESQHNAMIAMNNNMTISNLVNNKRRGMF